MFDFTVVPVETDFGITDYAGCYPLGSAQLPAYALGVRSGLAELGPKMLGPDSAQSKHKNPLQHRQFVDQKHCSEGLNAHSGES